MYPLSTGQVALRLETTEPTLNHLLRRRRINPPPPVVSGRRIWSREHVLAAAEALDAPVEVREKIAKEVVHAP